MKAETATPEVLSEEEIDRIKELMDCVPYKSIEHKIARIAVASAKQAPAGERRNRPSKLNTEAENQRERLLDAFITPAASPAGDAGELIEKIERRIKSDQGFGKASYYITKAEWPALRDAITALKARYEKLDRQHIDLCAEHDNWRARAEQAESNYKLCNEDRARRGDKYEEQIATLETELATLKAELAARDKREREIMDAIRPYLEEATPSWNGDPVGLSVAVRNVITTLENRLKEEGTSK